MEYRDELIRRLKESGEWNAMTTDRRETINKMDDQLAGALLAHLDDLEIDSNIRINDLSNPATPEGQRAAIEVLSEGLRNLAELFNGDLFIYDPGIRPGLTPLGQSLAKLFNTAEAAGFSLNDVLVQLGQISLECALIIKKLGSS